jgi:hypothetical protein
MQVEKLLDLRSSYVPEVPAQVVIEYTFGQMYMFMQGISVEIQSPTHRDVIGRSMTVPRSLLTLSQYYPSATFVSLCRKENCGALFKNFSSFNFLKIA